MRGKYFTRKDNLELRCNLCPHYCMLEPGEKGKCSVRRNSGGNIVTDAYNNVSALAIDPIEKKPLYHFYPGKNILSAGSFGCNMTCLFCQNHDISQPSGLIIDKRSRMITAVDIIKKASGIMNNIGIAFTYNEPVVWHEFMSDIAEEAKKVNMKTVMVSNGYINSGPLDDLLPLIDAFNIDLKAFNNDFYRKYTGSTLKPVLNSIRQIKESGKHLEITFLIIPGHNDDSKEFERCISWMADTLGKETILHLSRYFPSYSFTAPVTPFSTMENFYRIASDKLDFVYPGNINMPGIMNTVCPGCGNIITERSGYQVNHLNTVDGKCSECGKQIYDNFI